MYRTWVARAATLASPILSFFGGHDPVEQVITKSCGTPPTATWFALLEELLIEVVEVRRVACLLFTN